MATTMLAVHMVSYTDPLQVVDIPIPNVPAQHVLIKVAAAGMNNTDVWTREGRYSDSTASGWRGKMDLPRIQGGDVCGYITQVGQGVDPSRVGQRVLVDPSLYGPSHHLDARLLGSEMDGGFAEYCVVQADNAIDMTGCPLSDIELAAFPIAWITAFSMCEKGQIAPGMTVLVTGASGGVGSAALDLIKERGARPIAVTSGNKGPKLNVDFIDRAQDIMEQLEQKGLWKEINCVLDLVGGSQVETYLQCLMAGGRYVLSGAMAGFKCEIDLRTVYLNQITIYGSSMGTREEVRILYGKIHQGLFRPHIEAVFPLRDIHRAQEQLQTRTHIGKFVLHP
ncbi:hypothetical protein Unana1_05640 [Umbelopsis nana]